MAPEELLREDLRRLDLGRKTRGAEDRQIALSELVGDAEGQGKLRPDHGQIHLQLLGEIGDLDNVSGRNRNAVGDFGDARVARRAEELVHEGTPPQRPTQGMLPPTASDDQDFHVRPF